MSKYIYNKLLQEAKTKKENFLSNFSARIVNGDASLFIGTGLSMNSGVPSWKELLFPCIEQLKLKSEKNPDLFKIAQYYANQYSDANLRSIVNSQINNYFESNDVLASILSNEFKTIWTTNYDSLIEQELRKKHIAFNVITNERNLSQICTYDKVNIMKINGDISDPQSMVLTQNDYEKYDQNHSLFLTFLKKELVSNTFLFVGYSFSDQIVVNCLSSIMKLLNGAGNLHYALIYIDTNVTLELAYKADDLKKRYNIECIFVNSQSLLTLIRDLNNKVKENKVFISGAYYNVDRKTDEFADKLSKSIVVSLLQNGNRISTGVGKRLGTYITGYAHQYLAEAGVSKPSNYLSMRPFPFHLNLTDAQKMNYRRLMQHDCSAAIFMFGQSEANDKHGGFIKTGHYSSGVYQEFLIAKELGLRVIPIGSTGYESEIIWSEVKKNINQFYYLSKKIDVLQKEKNPDRISTIVTSILNQKK